MFREEKRCPSLEGQAGIIFISPLLCSLSYEGQADPQQSIFGKSFIFMLNPPRYPIFIT